MSTEQTRTIKDLIEDLSFVWSSPVNERFCDLVLKGRRSQAIKLITDKRFSIEEANKIYDHLASDIRGKNVKFVELPKRTVPEQKVYLVRYGSSIEKHFPYVNPTTGIPYCLINRKAIPWAELNQVWEIIDK